MHGYLQMCVDGQVTCINNRHAESVAIVGELHVMNSSTGRVDLKSKASQEKEEKWPGLKAYAKLKV